MRKTMRKTARKTARIAAWTGGALVGLVLLGLLAVWIFLPLEKIKELAVTEASSRLGREVTVDEVGLSVRGGLGVVLTGVAVGNPPGFAGEPFLAADGVDLKLRTGPLLRKRVEVDRLVVVRPRLHLLRTAEGADNFTFAETAVAGTGDTGVAGGGSAPAPVTMVFDRIEVSDASVVFRDAAAGSGVRLSGLTLTSSLNTPEPGHFALAGEAAWDTLLVDGPQPLPVLPGRLAFAAEFSQESSRTSLTRGDFEIAGLAGSLTATVDAAAGQVRTTGRLVAEDLDPADLLAFVPAEHEEAIKGLELGGRLRIEADFDHVPDRDEPLTVTGRAAWAEGTVAAPALPEPVEELTAAVAFDLASVRIETCEIRLSAGRIGLQGGIDGLPTEPDAPAPHVDLIVQTDLDLAFLAANLPPELEARLAGRLAATVTLRGAADDPAGLLHEARATVRDLAYADTRLPVPLEEFDADLSWEHGVLAVTDARARFPGSDLSGRITVRNLLPWVLPPDLRGKETAPAPDLEFVLRSGRLDVDRLVPAASPGGGSATTPAAPSSPAGETPAMPDLTGGGTVSVDTLIYSGVELTNLAGRITLRDRRVECRDLAGQVYTGTVTGSAVIDLGDMDEPAYSGEFRASRIEADDFLTRFTRFGGLMFGKFDLEGTYAAAGRDPERLRTSVAMDARARMNEGKVVTSGFVHAGLNELARRCGGRLEPEQSLRDLATAIRVVDGRVIIDDLKTRLGDLGDLQLGGSYGLDGGLDYSGTLLLSENRTRELLRGGLAGGVARLLGTEQTERLSLPLRVDGSFAKPRFGLDYEVIRREAGESLSDQAKKKLKGLFD